MSYVLITFKDYISFECPLKIVTVVNFDKVSFEMNDILRVFHFNSKWRVSGIFTDCFVFFQIEKKVAIEQSSARIAISFFFVTRTTTRKC